MFKRGKFSANTSTKVLDVSNILEPNNVNWSALLSGGADALKGSEKVIMNLAADIAHIKLTSYSPTEFLKAVSLGTFDTLPYRTTNTVLKQACAAIVGLSGDGGSLVNRSSLFKGTSQTAKPEFSTGTPFILYAYKKFNNVPYEDWDFTDPRIKHLVGSKLAEVIAFRDFNFEDYFTAEILNVIKCITKHGGGDWALTKGTVDKLKGIYNADQYDAFLKDNFSDNLKEAEVKFNQCLEVFNNFPSHLKLMLLGKWVFANYNSQYIVKNPNNWDADPLFSLKDRSEDVWSVSLIRESVADPIDSADLALPW